MSAHKKVLLLFISEHSGHHCASIAIENAINRLSHDTQTLNINSFNYTNPILEKVINKAYMGVVKRTPEIWDYLYDNPKVLRNTQNLRTAIHRFNTGKLKSLLDNFKPDVIVCTQAFPCGMVADYKKSFNLDIPLIGVLTDYAPHSYWIYNNVDKYIVPSDDTGRKLIENGVSPDRIAAFGIPIDPRFGTDTQTEEIRKKLGIEPDLPCVLIMGGTQGLGPIKNMVKLIDSMDNKLQVIIASGTNMKLNTWLNSNRFRKRIMPLGYAKNMFELMNAADIVITKPGGITTAEALSAGLPILIVHPLPGQEAMNTKYLLREGVAVKADTPNDAITMLSELLYNKDKLKAMRQRARSISKPNSSEKIAQLILEMTK